MKLRSSGKKEDFSSKSGKDSVFAFPDKLNRSKAIKKTHTA